MKAAVVHEIGGTPRAEDLRAPPDGGGSTLVLPRCVHSRVGTARAGSRCDGRG
jgi:hypothetical protein